ncbi:hypothetical protein Hanom_Chr01g00067221 [Helianthus anomalus]
MGCYRDPSDQQPCRRRRRERRCQSVSDSSALSFVSLMSAVCHREPPLEGGGYSIYRHRRGGLLVGGDHRQPSAGRLLFGFDGS